MEETENRMVAVCDVLGFSELVKDKDLSQVLHTYMLGLYRCLENSVTQRPPTGTEHPIEILRQQKRIGVAWFSDTILLYGLEDQAKGKIERRHDYWQKRLPALLAADQILELCGANHLLDQLVPHANEHEIHRELGTTPQAARDLALTEKRSVLRPAPACPWWPFIWSQRTRVRGGDDGKVPVRDQRHSLDAPPRSHVIRCLRPDGDIYYLRQTPDPQTKPLVLLHGPIF